jgi:hypothetical protein
MFNILGAVVGAIASHNAQKRAARAQEAAYKRMLAEQAAARKRQAAIDARNRELAKQDASNKFTDMNKAASKAGINPLTALRATGGAGYGAYGGYNGLMQSTIQAPVLSKQSFAMNLGTRLANTFIDMKMNAPIDKYNAEVRKLELEQRRLDIKLSKQTLMGMTQKRESGMPKVPNNVMSTYSLGTKNEYLATLGGNVTTNTGVTPTEIGVDSRGNTYRKPAGEDFDEQLLNSVYHGVQQLRYGVLDAWNWATKGQRPPDMPKPTLKPNVPIIGTFESNGKLVMGPNFRDRFGVGAPYYNY